MKCRYRTRARTTHNSQLLRQDPVEVLAERKCQPVGCPPPRRAALPDLVPHSKSPTICRSNNSSSSSKCSTTKWCTVVIAVAVTLPRRPIRPQACDSARKSLLQWTCELLRYIYYCDAVVVYGSLEVPQYSSIFGGAFPEKLLENTYVPKQLERGSCRPPKCHVFWTDIGYPRSIRNQY